MEFFLVNAIIAIAHQKLSNHFLPFACNVDDFLIPLEKFPENVMPQRRKRRAYISSILSKNEVDNKDIYNRKLFRRVRRGYYILNPQMLIKVNENWTNIYQLLNLEIIKENDPPLEKDSNPVQQKSVKLCV